MCQYDNEEDDLSRSSNESEEDDEEEIHVEELLKKPKKGKKGTRVQWTKHLADDLLDIILDNDKCKVKLLGGERVLARFPFPCPTFLYGPGMASHQGNMPQYLFGYL